jgi:phosphatidylglycerophosphate synthase
MWLAHALTLSRIPIGIALWYVWGDPLRSVVLVGLAALSDTADGRVARWMKRRSVRGPDIGGWLDPVVDKLFVALVLAAVWRQTHDLGLILLIGARELVLVPLVAVYLAIGVPHAPLRADWLGKLATIAQFIALCVIALAPAHALPVAGIAAILGLTAAIHYVVDAARTRPTTAASGDAAMLFHGDEARTRGGSGPGS